ncbi:bifunctional phosphopantothenoylcysteine decarboxylase/phosphopantothenate--cysteine ligase CoaBC [Amnibacterium sp. CER49]|uniref:bifunctional phosphopantothenoylcysteine decarboxylase/phosphopantothenate--cysteine ligase CoaBC n=1 Tax=Amnibacterium sp. CER49 TaxID=3039161 RepID=UPI00244BF68D|nr:bifunctional phosphopantothenoylcysteine decarboxylase/phosphopantothenate--cysteine ligase CoaBC [Amnibacterium sp. CER49]MDH2444340.1 bifunctional phosphopantothenoylcysteine decarboxylase/phosphopantothenate--cysteine ligase CoaBC [Amnibacterium sp. CER49]
MRVVVGISGGIAAYKAVGVVRGLVLAGHDVHVVPTASALRFVGRPTLEAISRNPVETDLYDGVAEVRHVALGQSADLIVVAPATANTLARLAAGLADDLLGTTVLASRAPLVVAPAMHTEMWENAATRANVATLVARGVHVVGPVSGRLTGSDSGPGRMAEPEDIVATALDAVRRAERRPLAGRRVLVTAGGTREPLDPVRFLGNASSGRQGVAIAEAARDRGAEVVLVAAHLEVPAPDGVRTVPVRTAQEMLDAVLREADGAHLVVMAAAVADYRPASVAEAKLKKADLGDRLSVDLVRNPDVLATVAAERRPGRLVVGFAAETEPDRERLLALGRAKLQAKGADFLVVNEVGLDRTFGAPDNRVVVLAAGGVIAGEAAGDKRSVADAILDVVVPHPAGA